VTVSLQALPAELDFGDGPLAGLKLIDFSIWERGSDAGRNGTLPARQYAVNGERRSFAVLRPIADVTPQDACAEAILEVYAEAETAIANSDRPARRTERSFPCALLKVSQRRPGLVDAS
jgi:hypothetical protein